MSWMLSPSAWPFWEWFGRAIEAAVAVGVAGETYCHLIPAWVLPSSIRSDAKRKWIGDRSALILVIALALAVPVKVGGLDASNATVASLVKRDQSWNSDRISR